MKLTEAQKAELVALVRYLNSVSRYAQAAAMNTLFAGGSLASLTGGA